MVQVVFFRSACFRGMVISHLIDVLNDVFEKIVRVHPHVFGDSQQQE